MLQSQQCARYHCLLWFQSTLTPRVCVCPLDRDYAARSSSVCGCAVSVRLLVELRDSWLLTRVNALAGGSAFLSRPMAASLLIRRCAVASMSTQTGCAVDPKLDGIAGQISSLTLLETANLVQLLKVHWLVWPIQLDRVDISAAFLTATIRLD